MLRNLIAAIGSAVPSLAKLLAKALPVAVPGYSPGADRLAGSEGQALAALRLKLKRSGGACDEAALEAAAKAEGLRSPAEVAADDGAKYKVAVIGGGVAGCGAAWALNRSGFDVTLYEAREQISGNARTFDWDFSPFREEQGNDCLDNSPNAKTIKSCVAVTAWPATYYKNYTALLAGSAWDRAMPLSWFLNSKVKDCEGSFWGADPTVYQGPSARCSRRTSRSTTSASASQPRPRTCSPVRAGPAEEGRHALHVHEPHGLRDAQPLERGAAVLPLQVGSGDLVGRRLHPFLHDELPRGRAAALPRRLRPAHRGAIPLNPTPQNAWHGSSHKGQDCHLTTCVTWKDAGVGIRGVFQELVDGVR